MSATFILDGSNLAWLGPGDGPALAPVDAIADALRAEWPGCKVIAVCDASLRHRLDERDKAEHQRRTTAGALVEAPADEDADAYILDAARRLEGCVVTRDLYRDRREARAGIPMLRPALIGGAVILGDPKVFTTADSDRGEALPADALGERVPPTPLPGGDAVPATAADEPTPEPEAPPEPKPEPGPEPEPEAQPEPESQPEPPPKPKAKSKPGAKSKTRSTAKPRSKAQPRSEPEPRSKGAPEPQPAAGATSTAFGAVILLALASAIGGVAWWLTADPLPSEVPPDGVLFVRNCKGWWLADGEERIVFHARPDACATSIAAAGPGRWLVTVIDGPGPRTEGAVRLVTADPGGERSAVELTRGRPGAGELVAETADARIAGLDPAGGLVALEVSPAAGRPSIWVVRTLDGGVRAHTERAAGLALTAGRAAVLRHHCRTADRPGCGTAHIADDLDAALAAAETAAPPEGPAPRWAGPAAFSPDGRRLALAEAFDGPRGGVVLIDVATGDRRRLDFTARDAGRVTGLAWTSGGLYLGVGEALYALDPNGDPLWRPVARKADRAMPAHTPP